MSQGRPSWTYEEGVTISVEQWMVCASWSDWDAGIVTPSNLCVVTPVTRCPGSEAKVTQPEAELACLNPGPAWALVMGFFCLSHVPLIGPVRG